MSIEGGYRDYLDNLEVKRQDALSDTTFANFFIEELAHNTWKSAPENEGMEWRYKGISSEGWRALPEEERVEMINKAVTEERERIQQDIEIHEYEAAEEQPDSPSLGF